MVHESFTPPPPPVYAPPPLVPPKLPQTCILCVCSWSLAVSMPNTTSKRPSSSLNSPLSDQKRPNKRRKLNDAEDPFRGRQTTLMDLAKIIHSNEEAAIFLIEKGVIKVSIVERSEP